MKRDPKLTLKQLQSLDESSALVEAEKLNIDMFSEAYMMFIEDNDLHKANVRDVRQHLDSFNNGFIKKHCPPVRYIGEGSERIVYTCDGRTCFKLDLDADNYQNKLEAEVLNNAQNYGLMCFPELIACSNGNKVIEVECCAGVQSEQQFKIIAGVEFEKLLDVINDIVVYNSEYRECLRDCHPDNKSKIRLLKRMKNRTDMQACIFDDFVKYQIQFSQFGDIDHVDNWGIAIRNGKEVVLPIDVAM